MTHAISNLLFRLLFHVLAAFSKDQIALRFLSNQVDALLCYPAHLARQRSPPVILSINLWINIKLGIGLFSSDYFVFVCVHTILNPLSKY